MQLDEDPHSIDSTPSQVSLQDGVMSHFTRFPSRSRLCAALNEVDLHIHVEAENNVGHTPLISHGCVPLGLALPREHHCLLGKQKNAQNQSWSHHDWRTSRPQLVLKTERTLP